MQQRRKFSAEFKRETVGLTRQPASNVSQIAQDVGVNANLLWRWRRELDADGKKSFRGACVARDQELLAPKCEPVRVEKERDFLRDAAAFFANESSEVRGDPVSPRPVPDPTDVPVLEGVSQRLLRLVYAEA